MQTSLRSLLLCIGVHCVCLTLRVSSIDTLKQGDTLNSSSQLDSPNALFSLGFTSQGTNDSYIAVLFNPNRTTFSAVWVGNREQPLPSNSKPLLTLGTTGELTIHDGGDPIQLYAGSPRANVTVTATLLDTGNFVIGDGSVLWQSSDHPTDTLLSGMKLGGPVNSPISSWLTLTNPASGAFTLEWDPSAGELIIRRRGVAYWRSGQLKDYYDEILGNVKQFENFDFNPDAFNFNYNLTSGGDYFMFTVIPTAWTSESRKVASGWRLGPTGDLSTIDDRGMILATTSSCYGYSNQGSDGSRGCELWAQPDCRNRHQTFVLMSGLFRHANQTPAVRVSDNNSSLGLSDCREACWRWSSCECAGYANYLGLGYGCSYWIGKDLVWDQDLEGSMEKIYVLQPSGTGWFSILYMIFLNDAA